MKLQSILGAALVGLAAVLPGGGPATAQEADPEDMVNAINGLYGSHKGYRAVHAKGSGVPAA